MDLLKQWWIEERVKRAIKKLEAHEFGVVYARTKEAAAEEIWKHVTPGKKVGIGGSLTIRQLGILERLTAQGNPLFDHWQQGLSPEGILEIRKAQVNCDIFLSSVNAVTLNGELINIDGIGNRVNASSFGPGKVILVAGYNKIVEDVAEGIHRTKNVAQPMNAKYLNLDLPCAKAGRCVDCNSPGRGCRIIVIYERRPRLTDMLLILVGEELGL